LAIDSPVLNRDFALHSQSSDSTISPLVSRRLQWTLGPVTEGSRDFQMVVIQLRLLELLGLRAGKSKQTHIPCCLER
jgi:hypothetical protein